MPPLPINWWAFVSSERTSRLDAFITWFSTHLGFLSPQAAVTFVSMLPIIELRGGIPLARLLKLPVEQAIFFSVLGNAIPIPFILLLINKIFDWLRPTKVFGPLVRKLEARAMSKSEGVQKAEFWGLVLFVGIPLPGTGAWTGSLIACLLEIDKKKAFCAVILGLILATAIMCVFTYGIPAVIASMG